MIFDQSIWLSDLETARPSPPKITMRSSQNSPAFPHPPAEEGVENSRKDALQFEEVFTPREFWDMLHENDPEDHFSRFS
ncbi:hypothetical protein [Methanofollis sp. W23]|uniref:hypothetical protein n=1 Tax=Methanofollis sp. W23 TaxID=2817849 RepID=UPI001AE3399E|nr:hypothetical protein [Methanofollis sp. W23]